MAQNGPMNTRNRRTRRTRPVAALSLALVAGGCGMFSGPPAPAPMPDPAGQSVVVLYHVHLGPPADDFTDHNVYIDGTKVGRLNEGEELRLRIAPGVRQLNIRPETRWLGFERRDPIKYSLQIPQGATNYLRYRTTIGEGRVAPVTGTVFNDRELSLVTQLEYDAKN
jgi:hypothetical protein